MGNFDLQTSMGRFPEFTGCTNRDVSLYLSERTIMLQARPDRSLRKDTAGEGGGGS